MNMTQNKLRKDGMVAVLYSPGFGAGWHTWNGNYPDMVFDADIAAAVLENDRARAEQIAASKYPGACLLGATDLEVEWVKEGSAFEITEYDGSETVHVIGERSYLIA